MGGPALYDAEELDPLVLQENRDMDYAILESEKERDVIQVFIVVDVVFMILFIKVYE